MSWLHSQQSNFVFTVPMLMEGTVYIYIYIYRYSGLHKPPERQGRNGIRRAQSQIVGDGELQFTNILCSKLQQYTSIKIIAQLQQYSNSLFVTVV